MQWSDRRAETALAPEGVGRGRGRLEMGAAGGGKALHLSLGWDWGGRIAEQMLEVGQTRCSWAREGGGCTDGYLSVRKCPALRRDRDASTALHVSRSPGSAAERKGWCPGPHLTHPGLILADPGVVGP